MITKTLTIDVDSKDAVKGFEQAADGANDFNKSLDGLNDSLDQSGKKAKDAGKDLSDAGKSASKSGGLFKRFGQAIGNVGKVISAGLGIGIVLQLLEKLRELLAQNQTVVDNVNTAFTALSIAFNTVFEAVSKTFQAVSEANGGFDATKEVIGSLLTIALTPLKVAFQTIKAAVLGAQLAWEQSFFGSGDEGRIEELKSQLGEVGEAFKEIGTDAVDAAVNIGENVGEAVTEIVDGTVAIVKSGAEAIQNIDVEATLATAKNLEARRKAFELQEIQQQALIEQYDLEAEKQRQIRDNDLLNINDRIAANQELGRVLEEQSQAEKANIESRIAFLNEQQALLGDNFEREKEIQALRVELTAVDAKVAGFRSEQLVNENALIREQRELDKSRLDAKVEEQTILDEILLSNIDREDRRLEKELEIAELRASEEEARLEAEIARLEEGTQAKVDAENKLTIAKAENEKQRTDLEKQYSEARKKINEEENKAKIQNAQMILGGIKALLSQFAEESKGLAIASVIIDAAQAAIGIWAGWASLGPIGIAGAALQSAALVAATVKSINTINSTNTDGGGSPPNIPSPATGAGGANPIIGAGNSSQITGQAASTNAILDSVGRPVKAYVVSTEVTDQQELDRKIQNNASLGG